MNLNNKKSISTIMGQTEIVSFLDQKLHEESQIVTTQWLIFDAVILFWVLILYLIFS